MRHSRPVAFVLGAAMLSRAARSTSSCRRSMRRSPISTRQRLNSLFEATVEATEEAVVNALVAAETMTGADDVTVHALPHDRLREALRKYGRLASEGH